MLKGEHSAILSTFITLPFVIKIFVLSILSGRFTVCELSTTNSTSTESTERSIKKTSCGNSKEPSQMRWFFCIPIIMFGKVIRK